MSRCFVLIEVQRYLDQRLLGMAHGPQTVSWNQDADVMRWGMNLCTSELLRPLEVAGAVPLGVSSEESRHSAASLLYRFGVVALLRRAAEMARVGMLQLSGDDMNMVLNEDGRLIYQFMDDLEHRRLEIQVSEMDSRGPVANGWTLIKKDRIEGIRNQVGAFSLKPRGAARNHMSYEAISAMIAPLNRLFATPYGTFLEYDSDARLDDELFAMVQEGLPDKLEHAGIHASVKFKGFSATELLVLIVILEVLCTKHIYHCRVAMDSHPEVDAAASLTAWQSKQELLDLLQDASGLDRGLVEHVLSFVTVTPADMQALADESVPLLPIFIDLGNGMLLRPASSVTQNQLVTFTAIAKWRDGGAQNAISEARESWFRAHLYALFQGNRYIRIEGNVVLREDGRKATDIDAAILDRVTGELAIFQLKWQDYFSTSVKQLGSRAKNFASEVDGWADAVFKWLSKESVHSVAQTLRLDPKKGQIPLKVFLFGISWRVARSAGYGYPVGNPLLSVATWPQFCRARMELGPVHSVFDSLHEILRKEEAPINEEFTPAPYVLTLSGGARVVFEDLWCTRMRSGSEAPAGDD